MTTRLKGGCWRNITWEILENTSMTTKTENNDENEGRLDDEAREAREIAHERECWSRDIEQGIEPAGVED